jgi:hypothetical protein
MTANAPSLIAIFGINGENPIICGSKGHVFEVESFGLRLCFLMCLQLTQKACKTCPGCVGLRVIFRVLFVRGKRSFSVYINATIYVELEYSKTSMQYIHG